MYRNKFVVVLCVIGIVNAYDDFKILDSIKQEYPCTLRGGFCTIAADCPKLASEKGLCPKQRSMGVECCHGMSEKETRCEKRGGSCFMEPETCNDNLKFKAATDCPKGSTCCILVQ